MKIKNLFIYINNMSILYKQLITSIIIISFLIILSFIDFNNYKKDKDYSSMYTINQMNSQFISETDSYMGDLEKLATIPLFINNHHLIQELSSENISQADLSTDSIQNTMQYILYLKDDIHSVFIFNLKGESAYTFREGSILENFNPSKLKWFSRAIDNRGSPVIIPTFKIPHIAETSPYVFSIARGLVDSYNLNVTSVILINIKMSYFENLFNKLILYKGQRIILTDNKGNTLYDTVTKNIAKKTDKRIFSLSKSPKSNSKYLKINNHQFIMSCLTSSETNWRIINLIPLSSVNKNITQAKIKTTIITGIFVFLILILVIYLTKSIINPIKKLSKLMKLVEKGDFDIKVKVKSYDEIGQLSTAFNSMTNKVKQLIDVVYIEKINQKELEIEMLQNQINPHFLYNTLESIHMMAKINHDSEASKMALNLGKMLRYSLSKGQTQVTIRDEISNLNNYIMLQKIRFDYISDIIIDIREEIYNQHIIKLVLQPLVENALYHGLSSIKEGGIIRITAEMYNNNSQMILSVIDNGIGINSENVKLLNDYINNLNSEYNSIGLRNVNMRLKLVYGDKYGLRILSTEGLGTTIQVFIPCK